MDTPWRFLRCRCVDGLREWRSGNTIWNAVCVRARRGMCATFREFRRESRGAVQVCAHEWWLQDGGRGASVMTELPKYKPGDLQPGHLIEYWGNTAQHWLPGRIVRVRPGPYLDVPAKFDVPRAQTEWNVPWARRGYMADGMGCVSA